MKTLSASFLRYSATALGYELTAPKDNYPRGVGFDLRDEERLYPKNASRTLIARFLLEAAVARIENEAACEAVVEAAPELAATA